MRRAAALALCLSVCASCGPPPFAPKAVIWNADGSDLGKIVAVTELEDVVVVYGDQGVTVLSGAAVTSNDRSITAWRAAATIAAADETGAWAVGVDAEGRILRLRARTSLEEITDRYGLDGANVAGVAAQGAERVAFAIDGGVALADGMTVTRFDEGPLTSLAGGAGRVAGVAPDGSVRVLDGATGASTRFPLTDAVAVAIDLNGKLVVATKHALYQEDAGGLKVIYSDDASSFHGLAASGKWTWVAADGELLGWDGTAVHHSSGLDLPRDGTLAPSSSGDVWLLSSGTLQRFTTPVGGDEDDWRTHVLPVYARVCSACHSPGGSSGIPLSVYQQWLDHRDQIYDRVIVKGDMPQGRTLSDADKTAIAAWSKPN
jgi:hypothetical protein